MDETSLIGQATGSGDPAINQEVGIDEEHPSDPMHPETRSEVALPLRVGDQIIGVLNVHSRNVSAFDADMVSVLQTLADQLAVAISNTRLLREMTQTLRELEVATGRYTQQAWQSVVRRAGGSLGFRYRGVDIEPLEDYRHQDVLVLSTENEDDQLAKLSVPIRMRDQVIGTLNLRLEEDETLPETTALAESVAERMALAIENARLLEETQQLADQERFITQITEKMQYNTNIEDLIQETLQDLYSALSASHVVVHLGTEDQLRDKLGQQTSPKKG